MSDPYVEIEAQHWYARTDPSCKDGIGIIVCEQKPVTKQLLGECVEIGRELCLPSVPVDCSECLEELELCEEEKFKTTGCFGGHTGSQRDQIMMHEVETISGGGGYLTHITKLNWPVTESGLSHPHEDIVFGNLTDPTFVDQCYALRPVYDPLRGWILYSGHPTITSVSRQFSKIDPDGCNPGIAVKFSGTSHHVSSAYYNPHDGNVYLGYITTGGGGDMMRRFTAAHRTVSVPWSSNDWTTPETINCLHVAKNGNIYALRNTVNAWSSWTGSQIVTLQSVPGGSERAVWVDSDNNRLWATTGTGGIHRYSLPWTFQETIRASGSVEYWCIEYHTGTDKLYFVEYETASALTSLCRMNPDGTGFEKLYTSPVTRKIRGFSIVIPSEL